jgi:Putative prokaryotic signal transducing protein
MSDVVTVARFNESLEADMARLRLQSAGIETFLSGENGGILEPGLGPLQLQVSAEDEADARAILADPGLTDTDMDARDTEPSAAVPTLPKERL